MPLSNSSEWPIRREEPWRAPGLPWGVSPLRHDIAVARYLEKQAYHRASTPSRLGFATIATHIRTVIAHVGGAFSAVCVPSIETAGWGIELPQVTPIAAGPVRSGLERRPE